MQITKESALELLEMLYKLNGIGKTADGNFVLAYEDGWAPCPPEEAAENLAENLEGIDAIRAKISEVGEDGDVSLPIPELVLEGFVFSFDDHTAFGEPQLWIYLKDKTSIEVTHEESGLGLKDQYFSVRHHCSEEDFENDVYHSTMGVIEQCSGSLADIAGMLERIIKGSGLEGPSGTCPCPVCGSFVQKSAVDDSNDYVLCCSNCGCRTQFEPANAGIYVSDDNVSVSVSDLFGHSRTSKHLLLNSRDPRELYAFISKEVAFDHNVNAEDLRKLAAAGYSVVSELHKRYNKKKIEAEAEALLEAALNGDPVTEVATRPTVAEPEETDWSVIGPRAVLSLAAVLYEKKLYQGLDDNTADKEADENVCEMTGLSLKQLGDLYETAGLDSVRSIAEKGGIR